MTDKYRLKTWQELPPGGVILESGNAADYETGTWRTRRPLWHPQACIHCLTCWVFCPEDAFRLEQGAAAQGAPRARIREINYYHCKGCGLCARECPVNKKGVQTAIAMAEETA